ncbi:hypothetical protein PG995_001072 [Apiospora arundinis]
MANDKLHQPERSVPQRMAEQHAIVTCFSHGDQEGVKHFEHLSQLLHAEPNALSPATRDGIDASITGIAMSHLQALQHHRERNSHELIQVYRTCPTGHADIMVAIQRFRDAQDQLHKLEERLTTLLEECIFPGGLRWADTPTHGSGDSIPGTDSRDNLSGNTGHPDNMWRGGDDSTGTSLGFNGSNLILLDDDLTKEKPEVAQVAAGNPPADRDRPTQNPSVWHNPKKVDESRELFNRSPSVESEVHTTPKEPMVQWRYPRTGRVEARDQLRKIVLPNEDIGDRIYDTDHQRQQAIRTYARQNGQLPPIFQYGVQYCPNLPLPLRPEQERSDYECRAVIISDLSIEAKLSDVLAVVRGGKILRATIVPPYGISSNATAMVQFANWRHAHEYSNYTKAQDIIVRGQKCSVALANTPSYPMTSATMNSLEQGFTRCVEVKEAPMEELGTLIISLRRWFSSLQGVLEKAMLDVGENRLVLRFRDVDFATRAYRLVKNGETLFPSLHQTVAFAADPCAEPVESLNEPSTGTDEGICLMDVIGNHGWNISTAYPSMGHTDEEIVDHSGENPSPATPAPSSATLDHGPDHAPDHEASRKTADESTRPASPVRDVIDQIYEDRPNWMFTDEEYLETIGFTSYLRDPKEWTANIGYWMGRTRKDLKPRN